MKLILARDVTNVTLRVFIPDSSSTTGAGLTGLAHNSSGLKCYFAKFAIPHVNQLTLVTQTVDGSHTDGGFVELDSTNMPGLYRLDLSDTVLAGRDSVVVMLHGATNMAPVVIEIQLEAVCHADIEFTRDQANTQDEYTVAWYENGAPALDATAAKITVYKRVDGTTLIAESSMTQIGSSEFWKYDESVNRITLGEAVIVEAKATVAGATRTWTRVLGRDSS